MEKKLKMSGQSMQGIPFHFHVAEGRADEDADDGAEPW